MADTSNRRPMKRRNNSPKRFRRLLAESLEDRRLLVAEFQNALVNVNVNNDQFITPLDALLVIGRLNNSGAGPISGVRQANDPFVDVNGDGNVTPLDALMVIAALTSRFQLPMQLTEGVGAEKAILIGLGQAAGARTYRLQIDARFDFTHRAAVEDVFNIYLRDPRDLSKTLLDRGEQGTALFSLVGRRAEYTPGQVRFDGTVLEIDLTSLATATQGMLAFELLTHVPHLPMKVSRWLGGIPRSWSNFFCTADGSAR